MKLNIKGLITDLKVEALHIDDRITVLEVCDNLDTLRSILIQIRSRGDKITELIDDVLYKINNDK